MSHVGGAIDERARARHRELLAARSHRIASRLGRIPRHLAPHVLLIAILFFMFVPIFVMLVMSLKRTTLIYADFWRLPVPPHFKNYEVTLLALLPSLLRTLWLYIMTVSGRLLLAALAAYAFARLPLFGRETLFYVFVLGVMMIPGVITLSPSFVLMTRLNLRGVLWGLAVSYIAGGQPFAVFLLTTFFRSQPNEMFESARVDGASEWQSLWAIAVPVARPILVTLAIMDFLSLYGDLIWPSLMLRRSNETLMMALMQYNPRVSENLTRPDLGPMTAGYVFACIPPLILFAMGMRYYIAGLTSGAVKG